MRTLGKELHCVVFEDPGHGWLAVKRKYVELSGIVVSPYSYERGQTVYLEEDCDLRAFKDAIEKRGFTVFMESRHTNKQSPIRSYAPFGSGRAVVK